MELEQDKSPYMQVYYDETAEAIQQNLGNTRRKYNVHRDTTLFFLSRLISWVVKGYCSYCLFGYPSSIDDGIR